MLLSIEQPHSTVRNSTQHNMYMYCVRDSIFKMKPTPFRPVFAPAQVNRASRRMYNTNKVDKPLTIHFIILCTVLWVDIGRLWTPDSASDIQTFWNLPQLNFWPQLRLHYNPEMIHDQLTILPQTL